MTTLRKTGFILSIAFSLALLVPGASALGVGPISADAAASADLSVKGPDAAALVAQAQGAATGLAAQAQAQANAAVDGAQSQADAAASASAEASTSLGAKVLGGIQDAFAAIGGFFASVSANVTARAE